MNKKKINDYFEKKLSLEKKLLQKIENKKDDIINLYNFTDTWPGEDAVYRFYHESFKVYNIQNWNKKAASLLSDLLEVELNKYTRKIINSGINKEFSQSDNINWFEKTKPIIDAYLHLKYIIKLIIKYGLNSNSSEREGNNGWFTVLYVYNIR